LSARRLLALGRPQKNSEKIPTNEGSPKKWNKGQAKMGKPGGGGRGEERNASDFRPRGKEEKRGEQGFQSRGDHRGNRKAKKIGDNVHGDRVGSAYNRRDVTCSGNL